MASKDYGLVKVRSKNGQGQSHLTGDVHLSSGLFAETAPYRDSLAAQDDWYHSNCDGLCERIRP